MLRIAKKYEEQLNSLYLDTIYDDKYKYFNCNNYYEYGIQLKIDSWNEIEFVSVDSNDNVIGYMSAKIDRNSDHISSLKAINFYEINITFSRDFHQFLTDLFTKYNFRKVCFSVVIGNPAEKMYDKYIKRYNGRIVGIYKEDVKLFDGKYYDYKCYEIHRSEFLKENKLIKR